MTLQVGSSFKRLVPDKDRLPASEWNRLVDRMEALLKSVPANAFASSSGLSFRNTPSLPAGTDPIRARIVQTLQYRDEEADEDEINWYEIELLSDKIEDWSDTHGTYDVDDLVRFESKIYVCIRKHESYIFYSPTNTTYWELAENNKALVWGYDFDLIDSAPWLQVNNLVNVIRYSDSRYPDFNYFILATVFRIAVPDGEYKKQSLYWVQKNTEGEVEARLAGVWC